MSTYDICALGELLVDFTAAGTSESGRPLYEQDPGGAPANMLVAAQRLGSKTAFVGKVGGDTFGAFLRDTLMAEGIDCEGLVRDPDVFTTLAFVTLDARGERAFAFVRKPGADMQLTSRELNRDIITASHVLEVGSLSLTDEPARTATHAAIRSAKNAGTVLAFDTNYRASLWANEAAAREQIHSVVASMDLVKFSDEECVLMAGVADPEHAAAEVLSQGPSVAVVTLGAEGCYVRCADGGTYVPGFPTQVVDATGAGDSFWGGFLTAFCESGLAPSELTAERAAQFARFGNAVSSLCIRKRGGIPVMPKRADVDELLAG